MKLSLLLVIIIMFCLSVNVCGDHDRRFENYIRCLKQHSVPEWKLLSKTWNSSYYEKFNFQFNRIFDKVYPIAIFTPFNVRDVQLAVICGINTDIQLVPNSGGHSYAALSSGTNNSIRIDFRFMKAIHIDEKERSVLVESGTFLGHLYSKLWRNGGWGVAGGVCPTVAVGGLALGGGIGYFSSMYGLVIDNLLEITMVDASGTIVRVNEKQNPDLWWAMRGVGPGYIGILTSVKLRMFKADQLKLTFLRIRFHNNNFHNVLHSYIEWLKWVRENDNTISTVMLVKSDKYDKSAGWPGIEVQILQIHDPELNRTEKPTILDATQKIFRRGVITILTYPTFIEFVIQNAHSQVVDPYVGDDINTALDFLSSLNKDMAIPHYFFANSFFVKDRYKKAEYFIPAAKTLLKIPKFSAIQINNEEGAIKLVGSNASSYVHRDVLFNIKVYFNSENVEDVEPSRKWTRKFLKSIRFLDSGETYQNYPERNLKDYLNRFYGSNLEKLIKIKRKWDPKGYFHSQMSIPID